MHAVGAGCGIRTHAALTGHRLTVESLSDSRLEHGQGICAVLLPTWLGEPGVHPDLRIRWETCVKKLSLMVCFLPHFRIDAARHEHTHGLSHQSSVAF
jgi:hypothetical protein